MKLERLRQLLESTARTKLHVVTERFALSGHASRPREVDGELWIHVEASVRFVLATGEVLEEPKDSGTLRLSAEDRVTRRLQTHRRHLRGLEVPERYLELAKAI